MGVSSAKADRLSGGAVAARRRWRGGSLFLERVIRRESSSPGLDALRRKRNPHDDYGLVAQGEANRAGKLAAQVRKEVEDWIRKNHADKIA
jgi:hypothetical protein